MTTPDLTVTDGASAPADGSTSGAQAPTPADVPTDAPSPEHLAAVGALGGNDLAAHLGAESLEAHAAAQVAQGIPDGTDSPFADAPPDTHQQARLDWIAASTQYATAFSVPGNDGTTAAFVRCTLCAGVFLDGSQDWHTEAHKRGV